MPTSSASSSSSKLTTAIGAAGMLVGGALWPLAHWCDDRDCGPVSIGFLLISVVLLWLQTIPVGGLIASLWSRRRQSSASAALCLAIFAAAVFEALRTGALLWLVLLLPAASWLAHHALRGVRAALAVWLVLSSLALVLGTGWLIFFLSIM